MDKSGANKAAMDGLNQDREVPIVIRQVKYLNNIVEQDHRGVKRIAKPMMGFKSFRSARNVLAGIELMHMIRKGQMPPRKAAIFPSRSNSTHWRPNCVQQPGLPDKSIPITCLRS